MCSVWLLLAAALVGVVKGAVTQCWDHPSCQQVDSDLSMQACLQLCRSLNNEMPLPPGEAHLQAPPPSELLSWSSPPQAKRSYSMEHFRWGKPVGRKRRPVKIYAPNEVEEELAEGFPSELRRRALLDKEEQEERPQEEWPQEEWPQEEWPQEERLQEAREEAELPTDFQEKKDGTYKMKHFRWSGPPASKRYGGFMKSWDERSQRPLLTLFKNVMTKDAQEEQ